LQLLGRPSAHFVVSPLFSIGRASSTRKPPGALRALTKAGYEISGNTYKLHPRSSNGNVAAEALALHSSLSAGVERKSPPELASPKFVA